MLKDLFFYEKSSFIEPYDVKIHWRVKKHLFSKKSNYQQIDFYESYDHGIIFVLDNLLMCTERDEFIYHESMACISTFSHENPKSVLVIGGGDGGLIHQLIKMKNFDTIHLCEIDPLVIETCQHYLPYIDKSLKDPRVHIYTEDGFQFLQKKNLTYDLILIDLTDPIGEAKKLFSKEFYQLLYQSLNKDGIFITQSGSPFYNKQFLLDTFKSIKSIFPLAKIFTSPCHSYPGGYWGFIFGSKANQFPAFHSQNYKNNEHLFDYYNKDIHYSAFALPNYLLKNLNK